MRIILSRKAFDTGSGGVPNPVLPDGQLVPLPIPDKTSPIRYSDITWDGTDIGDLVCTLTRGRIPRTHFAHVDPDLNATGMPRSPGWRPIFGQEGAAQGHLRNQHVGPGDLFLFFGLFRRVRESATGLTWDRSSPPRHVVWGWLQVDEVAPVDTYGAIDVPWARYHPHFHRAPAPSNTVYLARDQLTLNGQPTGRPGAGYMPRLVPELVLTAADAATTSQWDLPGWIHPRPGTPALSYHGKPERWTRTGDRTRLSTVGRGQEFVLDAAHYPQAEPWAADMISHAGP